MMNELLRSATRGRAFGFASPFRDARADHLAVFTALIMPYCMSPTSKARCMRSRHTMSRTVLYHTFGLENTGSGFPTTRPLIRYIRYMIRVTLTQKLWCSDF